MLLEGDQGVFCPAASTPANRPKRANDIANRFGLFWLRGRCLEQLREFAVWITGQGLLESSLYTINVLLLSESVADLAKNVAYQLSCIDSET